MTAAPADTTIPLPPCPSASYALSVCLNYVNLRHALSVILGRAIKNEYLALGTIFGTVGLTMLSMGGGKKEAPAAKPSLQQVKESVNIGASSKCVPLSCPFCAVS